VICRSLPLFAVVACVPAEEEDAIPTTGLEAHVTVAAFDDIQAGVVMTLHESAGLESDFYELALDEEITVTIPGFVISLIASKLDSQPVYTASVPIPATDADFIVSLNRDPPDKTADDSRVSLPLAFDLTAPGAFSRGSDDMEVTWSVFDQADPLTLEINGPCIDTYQAEVSDIGAVVIPAGSVTGTGESCPAELTLTRQRFGTVDHAFGSGSVVAFQQRGLALTANP